MCCYLKKEGTLPAAEEAPSFLCSGQKLSEENTRGTTFGHRKPGESQVQALLGEPDENSLSNLSLKDCFFVLSEPFSLKNCLFLIDMLFLVLFPI